MRTLRLYFLNIFQTYSSVSCGHHVVYRISMFVYNRKCVPFDHVHAISSPFPMVTMCLIFFPWLWVFFLIFFYFTYKNIIQYLFSLTQRNTLKVHACCHIWQDFLLCCGWVILYIHVCTMLHSECIYTHIIIFIYLSASLFIHPSTFPCLGYCEQCCYAHRGFSSLFGMVFLFSLDMFPSVKLLAYMIVQFLTFRGPSTVFNGGCVSLQYYQQG